MVGSEGDAVVGSEVSRPGPADVTDVVKEELPPVLSTSVVGSGVCSSVCSGVGSDVGSGTGSGVGSAVETSPSVKLSGLEIDNDAAALTPDLDVIGVAAEGLGGDTSMTP